MLAFVGTHIDKLLCFLDQAESRFRHWTWFANEGDHGAVGGTSWIHVQEAHAFHGLYYGRNGIDLRTVSSFTDIGYAFDKLALHGLSSLRRKGRIDFCPV